jgi:hypothetical protein
MLTAERTFEQIAQHAIEHADDSTRVITPVVGQYIPQGDVNLLVVSAIPTGMRRVEKPDRQLAPGNTRGSRHCIAEAHMAHVEFYEWTDPNPLEGPGLKFLQDTLIEHPEHGDQLWPAGTIVMVGYQRQGGSANKDRIARAID